jgi:glycosyltransferase 2 family protein
VRPSWRSALLWIGLAVTVVSTVFALRGANLDQVWQAFVESKKAWLVPALLVLGLAVWMRAVRWWSLYAPETRPPLPAVTRALLVGYFYNNVLPLRAGEAARVVALGREPGASRAEATSTVVLERAYDVLALLVLLFALLPWLPPIRWLGAALVLFGIVAFAVLVAVVVHGRWGHRPLHFALRPLHRVPRLEPERVERGALNLSRGLAGLRHPRVVVGAAFWTLLSWVVVGVSAWLVMLAFDLGLSPVAGVFVMITINLALILPSAPAAVGVFEAATLIALDAYDVPDSDALSYALVLHAVNFLPYILVGLVVLHRVGWRPARS